MLPPLLAFSSSSRPSNSPLPTQEPLPSSKTSRPGASAARRTRPRRRLRHQDCRCLFIWKSFVCLLGRRQREHPRALFIAFCSTTISRDNALDARGEITCDDAVRREKESAVSIALVR